MWYYYFPYSGLINAIAALGLGLFILSRNYKSSINRGYAFFAFGVCLWSFNYCLWLLSKDYDRALLFIRLTMLGPFIIPAAFLYFVTSLLSLKKKYLHIFNSILIIAFFLFSFTPIYIQKVEPRLFFSFWPVPGWMFHVVLAYFIIELLYAQWLLWKEMKKSQGARRNQITYIFVGMVVGFIGGCTNYPLWYGIPIPPYLNILVTGFVVCVAYAIFRHHLMDINVAGIRTGTFAIVYIVVLGIPFSLAGWFRPYSIKLLGQNWFWLPMLLLLGLATAGPFIYLYVQRRAENALLRRQRSYQNALLSLSKRMTRLRCTAELFEAIGTTIVDTVKAFYVGIYLRDEERNAFKIQFSHPKKDKSRFEEFLPIDHSIIKLLHEQKKPLLTYEVPTSFDRQGLYFSLIVPSFMEDELLAFIVLGAKPNKEMYSENDIVVFETLSYSMALSIENCFFWGDVENRQRQARLEELDAFSYSVAHEIHNPMTVINGNATLLLNLLKKLNMPEEKFQDVTLFLNHIIMCSDRVSKMVEAIHQFGQKTTGEFGPLDIRESVEIFSEAHAPELKYKGIAFVKEIPDEPIFIRGEQGELMMVFNNFYKNSLHALQAAPIKKITIKIEKITSDRVRVSFTDTGYGIEKSKLPIIFTQFVTTKASTEGSGMGLYVVKSVVNRHKGKIWAESEGKDKGATVILELPILKGVKETKVKEDIKSKWKF